MYKCRSCGGTDYKIVKSKKADKRVCIKCDKLRKQKYVESHDMVKYRRERYLQYKDVIIKKVTEYKASNVEKVKKAKALYYATDGGKTKRRVKVYKDATKLKVISHYSNNMLKCNVCENSMYEHLTLDHLNNDGAEHRKKVIFNGNRHGGNSTYLWVIRNNYPDIFQILCMNCNYKKYAVLKKYKTSQIKREVIKHYSNDTSKCRLCSESDLTVLTIDHINGNGSTHRKEIKLTGGNYFYRWLKNAGYPEGYQILCFNCNLCKSDKNKLLQM